MTENGLYLRAPTKLELETVKQACREHFILGRPVPEDRMFYEYAEEWYTIRKEPFISDASRASYKSCFIKHILPEFGLQHMKAISANDIQLNGMRGCAWFKDLSGRFFNSICGPSDS